jgi:hypothetical protein
VLLRPITRRIRDNPRYRTTYSHAVSGILVAEVARRYEAIETNPINFNLLRAGEPIAKATASAPSALGLELPQPGLPGVLATAPHGGISPSKSGSLSRVWEGTRKDFLVPSRLEGTRNQEVVNREEPGSM